MRAIFISYRREDAEGQAGRLFTDLGRIFGPDSVFMDVAGLEAGRDFRRAIDQQVASCGVLLAVIGKSWLGVTDASGKHRLDDPHDFVRLETAAALKRDIPVVPVLVQGAQMPKADQLPPDMADLAYRSALEVTHARWESDIQVLASQLRPYVDVAPAAAPASTRPPAPAAKRRSPLVPVAGAIALVALAGALWLWRSSSSAADGTMTDPVTTPAVTTPGQPTPAPSPDDDRAAEAKARADAARRAEAAAAAEHRARWPYYDFPEPNAGVLVFTIMPDGNPACASYDGSGCLWGQKYDDIDFSKLKPLVCGAAHKALWGATGYEDPMHWCSLARSVRPNRS